MQFDNKDNNFCVFTYNIIIIEFNWKVFRNYFGCIISYTIIMRSRFFFRHYTQIVMTIKKQDLIYFFISK